MPEQFAEQTSVWDWKIPSAQARAMRHPEVRQAAAALHHAHQAAEGLTPYDREIAKPARAGQSLKPRILERLGLVSRSVERQVIILDI